MGQLSRKERMMLQEQLKHEQVCVSKYRSYAERASPAVREMFNEFAKDEQDHYDMLSSLLLQTGDAKGEMAATSGGRFTPDGRFAPSGGVTPVDTFGRQAAQWSGTAQGYDPRSQFGWTNQTLPLSGPGSGPGQWQSTAHQMLYGQGQPTGAEVSGIPQGPGRNYRWGGLLPGDVRDTNHGDLTRGGLDGRGVNYAGIGSQRSLDVPEGFPAPHGNVHVMPSRLVRDGQDTARIWGSPDVSGPRVGSLRTGGWMSDSRFIYGGQEPRDVQPSALDRSIRADEQRLAGLGTGSTPWYGPSGEPGRPAPAWPRSLIRPSGPVSHPSMKMEVAEEWDGSDVTPWSDLTSPAPLAATDADEQTMLTDMLMTERFVSDTYDSAVFDSSNPRVRRVLQQIQRDEQKHGQRIRDQLGEGGL